MRRELTQDARQLLTVLADGRRTRWPLEELELRHLQAVPHMRGRPERRRELAGLVEELTDAGRLRASKRQDRTSMPALPTFVDVIRAQTHSNGAATRAYGWRPELSGVLALTPAPTPAEQRILRKVNRWLADRGQTAPLCGTRERSLEVFGDEKLLDERLRYGRLFGSGLLSYALLRTRRVAPGLVSEVVGDASAVLVVENTDTFRTLADILSAMAAPPVGTVAWGAGAAFEQSCEALLRLQVSGQPLQRAFYFGDIDPSGVRIPARAAQLLAPLALTPARPLYGLLLDRDQRGTSRERLTQDSEQHLRWLGDDLASRARAIMEAGGRLAQEALSAEVLSAHNGPLV